MQKAGWGRDFIASSRVAFALLAPAVAGCAPSPRAPVPESCILAPSATIEESRAIVDGAVGRISEMHRSLLGKLKEVEAELAALDGEACQSASVRFLRDAQIPIAEGAISGINGRMANLVNGLSEAEGDSGRMRELARAACVALETAEVTFASTMGILDSTSAEIRAASGKE